MSAPDPYLELAPLAALDALDGEDALAFSDHVRGCPQCRQERDSFEDAASHLGLAVAAVAPPPRLRPRVLGAVNPRAAAAASAPRTWPLAVAAAVAAAFGLAFVAMRQERDIERQRRVHADLAHGEVLALLADTGSRSTALAALPPAPRSGGQVVWNAQKRRAMVFASGLDPAPAGKAYEMWVIADGAPVPSGLFQVDASGRAVAELPWLEQTANAKTFAVTLEPAAGTAAPTGPMVLAGKVS